MTGYGRSERHYDNYRIVVEMKSVNNRYLDYNVRVFRQYAFLEELVRSCLAPKISRGKVDVTIQFDNVQDNGHSVILNQELAKGYYDALQELGVSFGLQNDMTVSNMARLPDLFTIEKKEQDKEQITEDTKQVLLCALDDLIQNRQREGERLFHFLPVQLPIWNLHYRPLKRVHQ